MNKKYELTDETIKIDGHILHRIKALKDLTIIPMSCMVFKGDLGGFVESEENLSDEEKYRLCMSLITYQLKKSETS